MRAFAAMIVASAVTIACTAEKHGASAGAAAQVAQPPTAALASEVADAGAKAPDPESVTDAPAPATAESAAPSPATAEDAIAQSDDDDDASQDEQDAALELPRRVLILGDSLAATGFGALLEKQLDAHPDIRCFRKAKSASGLARPDFYDWMSEARRQVKAHDPHLVVVIIGGNDGQDLTTKTGKGKRVKWQSEDWNEAYAERMGQFLDELGSARKVLWLGLPRMGLRSFEKKLTLIRGVQEDVIKDHLKERGEYVDTTAYTSDENGALLRRANVGSKKDQTLRADDGIHFTMAGSRYFAERVYPDVVRALGLDSAAADDAG